MTTPVTDSARLSLKSVRAEPVEASVPFDRLRANGVDTSPCRINSSPPTPWFRERWPWLLASGPLLVVVASVISAWIAIKSDDGLVSADYYRQGLAAQETLSRSDEAQRLGIVARIRLTSDSMRIVLGSKAAEAVSPNVLRVTISHPTRAGLDQTLVLARSGDRYEANFRLPAAGHWLLLVEDDARTWRIMGSVVLPSNDEIVMGE